MGLKEEVNAATTAAMKARDKEKTDALRLLKAAIQRFEIDRTDQKNPNYGKPITEEDLIGVVHKEIKQRRDSIEQFEKGGRTDLADKERVELAYYEAYLPKQMNREEIAAAVQPIIEREGKDFRKVMPLAAKELKGRAEGKLVSEIVKELTT
ncbi:MAG: GatB/YqeY domain-containing protein [Chloroflexota bacterium]